MLFLLLFFFEKNAVAINFHKYNSVSFIQFALHIHILFVFINRIWLAVKLNSNLIKLTKLCSQNIMMELKQ